MGQAKRRGTAEQRIAAAKKKEQDAKDQGELLTRVLAAQIKSQNRNVKPVRKPEPVKTYWFDRLPPWAVFFGVFIPMAFIFLL